MYQHVTVPLSQFKKGLNHQLHCQLYHKTLLLLKQLTSLQKLHSVDTGIQWHPWYNCGLQTGPIIDLNYLRPATKLNHEGHLGEL